MRYACVEETCSYEGADRYTMNLKGEICVDINNIASIFCPYCQSVMMQGEEALASEEENAM